MEYLKLSVPSHIIYLYYEFSSGKYGSMQVLLGELKRSSNTKRMDILFFYLQNFHSF